jgi:hypothetical protein
MKCLKLAFGLAVLATLLAVVASSAMALGPRWVTCVPKAGGTWEDSHCTKTSSSGSWETSELKTTVEVTSFQDITLENIAITTLECTWLDKGTVGAEGSDSITEIAFVKCRFAPGKAGKCEESREVRGRFFGLPWSTKLEERSNANKEKEVRDVLTSSKPGSDIGWDVECFFLGIFKVTDECGSASSSTNVRANRTEGSVEEEFEKESEKEPLKCLGEEKTGFIRGTTINRLRMPNRESLAFWLLAESLKT